MGIVFQNRRLFFLFVTIVGLLSIVGVSETQAQDNEPPAAQTSAGSHESVTDELLNNTQPPATRGESIETETNAASETANTAPSDELRTVVIDGSINLSYLFDESPDNFEVKYHIHAEGKAAAAEAMITGNAEIASQVQGYLSKWPSGECALDVTIPKVPFEMAFRKQGDTQARVAMRFKGKITETWQSRCTFSDAPGKHFDTKGDPEQWLAKALEKTSPSLSALALTLDASKPTTANFTINKQVLRDPPLGTAEIEGQGVITVKPGAAE